MYITTNLSENFRFDSKKQDTVNSDDEFYYACNSA